MLTKEENALLTQTGPGTPMGALLRLSWQPVALSEELPSGAAPKALKILGEDLVLFRDDQGRVGLLGLHCSHRRADLSYGRVENDGLRCLYHGWLYDFQGRCLEQPAELPGGQFCEKVRHPAYPCREEGGLIFAYMGTGEPAPLCLYEPLVAGEEHRLTVKAELEANFLQALENHFDPSHPSFLHRMLRTPEWYAKMHTTSIKDSTGSSVRTSLEGDIEDVHPQLEVEYNEFGFWIFVVRTLKENQTFLRINNFILPNVNAVPAATAADGYTLTWRVPTDDNHHLHFSIHFRRSAPLDKEALRRWGANEVGADYRYKRRKENRYLQDREEMKTLTFTGMGTYVPVHDKWAVESQEPIMDRTQEHLGYSDKGVIAVRQALLRALKDLEAGIKPAHVAEEGPARRVPVPVVVSDIIPGSKDWRDHAGKRISEVQVLAMRAIRERG